MSSILHLLARTIALKYQVYLTIFLFDSFQCFSCLFGADVPMPLYGAQRAWPGLSTLGFCVLHLRALQRCWASLNSALGPALCLSLLSCEITIHEELIFVEHLQDTILRASCTLHPRSLSAVVTPQVGVQLGLESRQCYSAPSPGVNKCAL